MLQPARGSHRAHQLLNDALDEAGEAEALALGRAVVKKLAKLRRDLGVGIRLELEPALLQDEPELLVVRDDPVVHDRELVVRVGPVRVAVGAGGLTVGRPSGVRHRGLSQEGLVEVDGGVLDVLTEQLDLADLLEDEDVARLVAVDLDPGRVIASVLEPLQAIQERLDDVATVLQPRL